MELPDREACYRAFRSRDARFDGLIYVGVTSTGIYCRPICPARSPKLENCRYFASAAAAQDAGFRPCLRCRPETAPDLASWRGSSNTVSRALALINDSALDGGEEGVEALAARLGVGGRQLRRLFMKHLGTSPLAVAQTRRVLFAKQLIHETQMPMSDIALAAGFGSVRRFNEKFRELFHRAPTALRHSSATKSKSASACVTLRLSYRPPYDWEAIMAHLRARAVAGVEVVEDDRYLRTVSIGGAVGSVEVKHLALKNCLTVTVRFPDVSQLPAIVARVRRVFDLGADINTITEHLCTDPQLASLVAQRPGLRAPGGWDGFELAVRAILGQQITVAAARRLAGQVVALYGEPVSKEVSAIHPGLSAVFPTADTLAQADLSKLGMPGARRGALQALAQAAISDPELFLPLGSVDAAVGRLRSIRGVGEWTAQYIALRALRETDAFPASDIGLLRCVETLDGNPVTPDSLLRRAEMWRPWRAYAAQHLWAADSQIKEKLSW